MNSSCTFEIGHTHMKRAIAPINRPCTDGMGHTDVKRDV